MMPRQQKCPQPIAMRLAATNNDISVSKCQRRLSQSQLSNGEAMQGLRGNSARLGAMRRGSSVDSSGATSGRSSSQQCDEEVGLLRFCGVEIWSSQERKESANQLLRRKIKSERHGLTLVETTLAFIVTKWQALHLQTNPIESLHPSRTPLNIPRPPSPLISVLLICLRLHLCVMQKYLVSIEKWTTRPHILPSKAYFD